MFALVGLGAALVVAVPLAWASHQFNDVPDANPFHDDISAIAGAGITAGKTCVPPGAPPTYCPGEGITREAMAAFVHRGFGRVGGDFLPLGEVPADISVPTGWTLDLTAGGVPGNTGFVKIDAEVGIANFDASTLFFNADLNVDGVDAMDDLGYETVPPGETGNIGLTAAVPVSTGAVHTVSVELGGGGDNGLAFADGTVTATYYPFGSTGGNILSTRTAANAKDGSLKNAGN